MKQTKILYVEDELTLANIVKDTLEQAGYQIQLISDGAKVMNAFRNFQPDLCILDVMLPNIDGFALGQSIHQEQPALPIIFLTAKNQTADVVKGFQSGGNDYLRKPFSLEELIVRIENLLRLRKGFGGSNNNQEEISIGKYQFYPKQLMLRFQEQERKLTYREAEVLQVFAQHQNNIVLKKKLLLDIWGDDTLSNTRNLDVYITKLRDYLSDDSKIEILTLRGVGYQFNIQS